MVYICEHCKILGSGWPAHSACHSCGRALQIKARQDPNSDDMYKGEFITLDDAEKDIFSIMHTFNHTHGRLFVSHDVDEFIKQYGFDRCFNYSVDPYLSYLEMNVR